METGLGVEPIYSELENWSGLEGQLPSKAMKSPFFQLSLLGVSERRSGLGREVTKTAPMLGACQGGEWHQTPPEVTSEQRLRRPKQPMVAGGGGLVIS